MNILQSFICKLIERCGIATEILIIVEFISFDELQNKCSYLIKKELKRFSLKFPCL